MTCTLRVVCRVNRSTGREIVEIERKRERERAENSEQERAENSERGIRV